MKMTVEVDNAKEEAKEIVEKCIKCGMCNALCPVLKVVREEQYAPRGQAIMIEKGFFEKNVYDCNLCKACEKLCPLDIKLCDAFIKVRKVLAGQKKEIIENKEMIKNLDKTGNVYGIKSD